MPDLHDPIHIYARLCETLEAEIGQQSLADLFRRLHESSPDASARLDCTSDMARSLHRIGIVSQKTGTGVAQKQFEELMRSISASVSRSPFHVALSFRIFAAGLYGVLPKPICGHVPQCKICRLTKICNYFNQPRRNTQRFNPAKVMIRDGVDALTDEDVLALLIGADRAGETQRQIAREVIEHFGLLRNVAKASYEELQALRNISNPMAMRIKAACALAARLVSERRLLGPAMRASKDFYDMYHVQMRDEKKEVFIVILLDQKNRVIREETVSSGTLTQALVHPREVFRPAIQYAAAKIAFLHNHPSGDSTPSREDITLTKRLAETGRVLGIEVLDHIVIGEGSYTSFIDDGLF